PTAAGGATKTADGIQRHRAEVHVQDTHGNPITGQSVQFSYGLGAGALAAAPPAVSGDDGVAAFEWPSQTAGRYRVVADIAGTQVAGSPAEADFTAGPVDYAATAASFGATPGKVLNNGLDRHAAWVTVQDKFGNPVAGAEVVFAADPRAQLSADRVISGAAGRAEAAITSTAAGAWLVAASMEDAAGHSHAVGDGTVEFGPGAAAPGRSEWEVAPAAGAGHTVIADGIDAYRATVTVRDGQDLAVQGQAVSFGVPASGAVQIAPAGPHLTDAQGRASVTLTSRAAGAHAVRAYLGGAQIGAERQVAFASGPPVFGPGASRLEAPAGAAIADGRAERVVSAVLADAQGNPAEGTVEFSIPSGVLANGTDQRLVRVDAQDGLAPVTLTSAAAGEYAITARVGASAIVEGSPARVRFTAGPVAPARSSLEVPTAAGGAQLVADGAQEHRARVTVRDAEGNPVAGQAVAFAMALDAAHTVRFQAVSGADGVAEAAWASDKAGTYQVTALMGAAGPPAGSPATAGFVPGPAAAGSSELTVSAGIVLDNGQAAHSARVTVRDANGNPVPGAPVRFTVEPGPVFAGSQGGTETAVSGEDGQASVSLTSLAPGSFAVEAFIGPDRVDSKPVTFSPGAADADYSGWELTPAGPLTADGAAAYTATVTALSANRLPVPGARVELTLPPGLTPSAPGPHTTGADGTASVTLTATAAGDYPVTARVGGVPVPGGAKTARFAAGPGVAANSRLEGPAAPAVAGRGLQTVTAWVEDKTGNPATAGKVVFGIPAGPLTPVGSAQADIVDGKAVVELASNAAGQWPVTATLNGEPITRGSPAQVAFTAGAADSAASFLTIPTAAGGATKTADGRAEHVARAQVLDAFGNPAAGLTVAFAHRPAGGAVNAGAANVQSGPDGVAEYPFASTQAGLYEVSAALAAGPIAGSGAQAEFAPGPLDVALTRASFATTQGAVLTDSVSTHRAWVRAQDAFGNPISGLAVAFALPQPPKAGGPYFDAAAQTAAAAATTGPDGQAEARMVSANAGVFAVAATVDAGTGAGPVSLGSRNVEFAPGDLSAAASTWSVSPATPRTADGRDAFTGTVALRSVNGLPIAGASVLIEIPDAVAAAPGRDLVTGADGTATVALTAVQAGRYPAAATAGGTPIGGPAELVFAPGPFSGNASRLVAPPGPAVADGAARLAVRAELADAQGNPIPGAQVVFDVPRALTVVGLPGPGPYTQATGPDGAAVIEVTSATAGDHAVTATAGGAPIANGSPAIVRFIPGAPDPAASRLTVPTAAGGAVKVADNVQAHRAEAAVADAQGNPVPGAMVVFSAGLSGRPLTAQPARPSGPDGVAAFEWASPTAGEFEVRAVLAGPGAGGQPAGQEVAGSPAGAVFVAGPVDYARTAASFGVTQGRVLNDGQGRHAAWAVVQDALGNPVAGVQVDFTADNSAVLDAASVVSGPSGRAETAVTSLQAGFATVAASIAEPAGAPHAVGSGRVEFGPDAASAA
ncbi:MAG: Ig-like domain-containing protein, partial [Bifidobacteriaceae bacterium]|nr:Ig-like domain-containing protein [Bifidobacteriaceae bacterium]